MKTTNPTRIPIPLSAKEAEDLRQLAQEESRSNQAMAGIIYRMGWKAYLIQNSLSK